MKKSVKNVPAVEITPAELHTFGVSELKIKRPIIKATATTEAPPEVLTRDELFELWDKTTTNKPLWDKGYERTTIKAGQIVFPELQGKTFSFIARNNGWDVTVPDYITMKFAVPCEVCVLLLDQRTAVPDWVEASFTKVSEANMTLELDWILPTHTKLLAIMFQRLQACVKAHLNVWRYKETCAPGKVYTFGGNEGRDVLLDYTYLLAWRPLEPQKLQSAPPANADNLAAMGAGAALKRMEAVQLELEEHAMWNELGDFSRKFKLYKEYREVVQKKGTATELEALRRLRPWYVMADGVLLTKACADRTGSLKVMLELISSGAEMDEVACRHLLHKLAEPRALGVLRGAQFRDLQHLLLHYCYARRRPLSSALALAAVLDKVAMERKAKYKEYTELAATLRKLATALVEKMDALEDAALGAAGAELAAAADGGGPGAQPPAEPPPPPSPGGKASPKAKLPPIAPKPNGSPNAVSGASTDPEAIYAAADAAAAASASPALASGGEPITLEDVLIVPKHAFAAGGQQQQQGGVGGGGGCFGGCGGGGGGGGGPPLPSSLNDVGPLGVACETGDVIFVSTSVVQGHLQRWWEGVDYTHMALQDNGEVLSYEDHHMLLHILKNSGFVGALGMLPARYFSYLVHYMLFCSRPYYDSPRGRWAFRLMCEAFFLYIFTYVQLEEQYRFMWQHAALVVYVASIIVDEMLELVYFYEGRLLVYFQDGFNVVEAFTILLLVAAGGCKAATLILVGEDDSSDGDSGDYYGELQTASDFLYNTASIFVWARLLKYMIPLYDGMGSLLMVLSQMTMEVLKFTMPAVILMLGVAMALYSLFRDRGIPGMDSLWKVMIALFRTFLGETIFDTFAGETSTVYLVYVNILIVLYAIAAAVVLANLLIAVISARYQAELVAAQSRLQRAQMTRYYSFMVRNQLLGAPFSLPLLLVTWLLPSGLRGWAGDYTGNWSRFKVLPMDGRLQATLRYPKGSRELPYVIYLLTFYPAVVVLTWATWVVLAPYCLVYFALYGYRNWQALLQSKDTGKPQQAKESSLGFWGLPVYLIMLPLWLLLGVLLYVGVLGTLVVLWGGVYQWLWRVAYYTHWVLRGWVEGWIPALGRKRAAAAATGVTGPQHAPGTAAGGKQPPPPPQQQQQPQQRDEAVGLEEPDVGLLWAARLGKRPALSSADIRAAMRDAGLSEGDVVLAVVGPRADWEKVEEDGEVWGQQQRVGPGALGWVRKVFREALAESGAPRR
ncbi:hypothetical protein HXX76_011985 [Chlamydomonas incerta]|uniref:Ion transport domain-containing protein n=1 Tax=Chlamydomonas incerta TaxID=51695 RepID=A0A835STJ1_CHLIN|nr:hypothetical protein HXX76_011985 [Chlamydomonas incerta]|eukprot:KAG2427999.1 hypothetical protein HXX76_011985 [Chlamydomonas incerta]